MQAVSLIYIKYLEKLKDIKNCYYINPKSLSVNKYGVNLNSLNVEGLGKKIENKYCMCTTYISSKKNLQRLYNLCLKKNEWTCLSSRKWMWICSKL